MGFNTKYILPGDNKDQIISKTNQNFSQVYYNSVGLPGEKGVIGPTGIIGQVGKDGQQGATGTRANIWFFQDTPPYSDIPYTEAPLINYDVWVNTSPTGSTGGLNRTYRYQNTYTAGEYPFWIDTGSNFTSGDIFTIIQGVSGPGFVTDRNAIVAGPTSTFVFTDRQTTESNSNPTYSKVLIENDSTASLPVFGFGKTFYSTEGIPAFKWADTSDSNYNTVFSGDSEIGIQSQSTLTLSATGGTVGVTAGVNINLSSNSTTNISATGGVSIQAPSLGVSSSNFSLETTLTVPNLGDGLNIYATGPEYSFQVNGTLGSTDSGTRTVFNYAGGPYSSLRPNINLASNGSSLFRINNAPDGTLPTLSIGFTGSIGISGGTGANVYKGYQQVNSTATSRASFGSGSTGGSNYITISPSADVIRVVPSVPTGTVVSANGRQGMVWLYITNIGSYVEASTNAEIDIYLDSPSYCIGGVALETNYSYAYGINGELQITNAGTGPSQGCRHVRINFFGNAFPSNINNTGNKWAYIEAFSSGNNVVSQVPWSYVSTPISLPSGFVGTVICTELYSQGFMPEHIRFADEQYGRMMMVNRPDVMIGYFFWAQYIVSAMKKSKFFSRMVWVVAKPWAHQMAYEMGSLEKGSLVGKALMEIGIFGSSIVGKILSLRNLFQREKKVLF